MYKLIRAYELGFTEGIKEAINNKNKKFKKIDELEVMSKLYDIGYVNGYKKYLKLDKNNSLKSNNNIV